MLLDSMNGIQEEKHRRETGLAATNTKQDEVDKNELQRLMGEASDEGDGEASNDDQVAEPYAETDLHKYD